ncbi:EST1C Carboxylesterase, partial [Polypterus senegalus]
MLPQHFRHTRKCWGEDLEGYPESCREDSRYFRHAGAWPRGECQEPPGAHPGEYKRGRLPSFKARVRWKKDEAREESGGGLRRRHLWPGLYIGVCSASQYDGSALAAYENVVVVVIQYRLGYMGFLSTFDKNCSGNWGLLDQLAALQWVQKHIKNFGGNPDSVTIFGESSGGCSVSALKVANLTSCDDSDSGLFVQCLRQKTEEDHLNVARSFSFGISPMTIDGVVLPKPVEELIKAQEFQQVPYLIGVTNDEFGWLLANGGVKKAHEYVYEEYVGNVTDPVKIRDLSTKMAGELFVVKPSIMMAYSHRRK